MKYKTIFIGKCFFIHKFLTQNDNLPLVHRVSMIHTVKIIIYF